MNEPSPLTRHSELVEGLLFLARSSKDKTVLRQAQDGGEERPAVHRREEGAALVTVLMLIALMAGLIALAMDRTGAALSATRARIGHQEARFDLLSAEAVAVARLSAPEAGQPLAFAPFSVPVPGGTVSARLHDGGACFNLNALAVGPPQGPRLPDPAMLVRLARLLTLSGQSEADAALRARQAADRVAGGLLLDAHELKAVPGIAEMLAGDALCALPVSEPARININALTPADALWLAAMIGPPVTPVSAEQLLRTRPAGGFASVAAFLARLSAPPGSPPLPFDTRSDWFRLDLNAQLGDAGLSERALIDARTRPLRVVGRIYGGP
jgi:general secretion pathway protein K